MASSLKDFEAVAVILIYFSLLCGSQTATPNLKVGISNVAIIEKETLNLTCTFSEPVSNYFNVAWMKEKTYIGRCQNGYDCMSFHEFNTSRISLSEEGRLTFRLEIQNFSSSDTGTYECGLEDRRPDNLEYSTLSKADVRAVLQEAISNLTCRALLNMSSGIQQSQASHNSTFQCSWLENYASANAEIQFPLDGGLVENVIELKKKPKDIQRSLPLVEYSNVVSNSARCVMHVPGLTTERSCDFPSVQPIQINPKTKTGAFTCPGENIHLYVLANGILKQIQQHPKLTTSYQNNIITIRNVTFEDSGLIILCTSAHELTEIEILALGKVITGNQETEDRLGTPSTLSINGFILRTTPRKDSTPAVMKNKASQLSQEGVSPFVPTWILALILISVVTSLSALAIALAVLVLTCRRQNPRKQDTERAEAKVAPISNEDYATIDPTNFKLRENEEDAFRLPENPGEQMVSNPTNKTIGFLRATSVIHALPTGPSANRKPKRRTQSENRSGNHPDPSSWRTHNNIEGKKYVTVDEMISHSSSRRSNPDEESTLNSRITENTDDENREVLYFDLEKTSSDDEREDDTDNKTTDTSIAEETTLGGTDDHDYFALEPASMDEHTTSNDESTVPTKPPLNNNSFETRNHSGYDNFRNVRVPYTSTREKTVTNSHTYDYLDPTSQC